MEIRETFANNVRKYRKAAHLSQERLAERAKLHRTYIGGIEQQRINVSLKNIGKIADALAIDPALLFVENPNGTSKRAWEEAQAHVDDMLRERGELRRPGSPPDDGIALVIWEDGDIEFKPIETRYEDFTIHILVDLIEQGYSGDALVEKYRSISTEINKFLNR